MSRVAATPALRTGEFVPLIALLISLGALAIDGMLPVSDRAGRKPAEFYSSSSAPIAARSADSMAASRPRLEMAVCSPQKCTRPKGSENAGR